MNDYPIQEDHTVNAAWMYSSTIFALIYEVLKCTKIDDDICRYLFMQYNCVYIAREVLKLYGMSSEMADTITQNSAVNKQGM